MSDDTSPDATSAHPFSRLTPDVVLEALSGLGLEGDGRLLPLNSYENRVYRVTLDSLPDGLLAGLPEASASLRGTPSVVVKFYRPGRWDDATILEEHSFVEELAEDEIPAVPALRLAGQSLHQHGEFRFAVFPNRGGRAPEIERAATLEWIGRYIGRIHSVGARGAYAHRPNLDVHSFGEEPRRILLESGLLPLELASAWQAVVDQALDGVRRAWERAGSVETVRLHGDCHAGNILWTDQGPHFVDFDDSLTGPAIQDLWMLLSGDATDMRSQLDSLLAGYQPFRVFNPRALHLVEALRTLRLIHYSAWLARRRDDPAFVLAFPWFNTGQYWEARIGELREQIELMEDPPLIA